MPLTLLQIVQRVQGELGLPQTTSVIGSTDTTTIQLLALANRCTDELRRYHPTGWAALQFEYDLVVPVPIATTGNLASPFTAVISGIPSTAALTQQDSFSISGGAIPPSARLKTVIDTNSVLMTMEATNTVAVTGEAITFSQDSFPIPVDFDWFQNRTMWDRTNRWELIGPDSPQMDQWHKSGIVVTGPRRHFRQSGPYVNCFRLWPPPTEIKTPLQLVFEYLSLNAVQLHGGAASPPTPFVFSQYFANDDDISLLDDQATVLGIKWMFWEAKGMGSYVTMQGRWIDYVDRMVARDGSAPTLQLAKRVSPVFISPANVQDGFFPGPTGPNSG